MQQRRDLCLAVGRDVGQHKFWFGVMMKRPMPSSAIGMQTRARSRTRPFSTNSV